MDRRFCFPTGYRHFRSSRFTSSTYRSADSNHLSGAGEAKIWPLSFVHHTSCGAEQDIRVRLAAI